MENNEEPEKNPPTTTTIDNDNNSSSNRTTTMSGDGGEGDNRKNDENDEDRASNSASSVLDINLNVDNNSKKPLCSSCSSNLEKSPSSSTLESDLNTALNDLKVSHLKEMTELRNQLDEVRTRATIIETTKQDEIDEVKFRSKQEIDSLNHIINALQADLNTIRNENEQLNKQLKDYKKQVYQYNVALQSSAGGGEMRTPPLFGHHHHHQTQSSSPRQTLVNLSPTTGGGSSASSASGVVASQSQHSLTQENESLEEDMRKAKESADMLRSVVLPLETEISTLRSRSSTSEKRIKELEKIIDDKEKERQRMQDEEKKLIDEALNSSNLDADTESGEISENIYFKKFIQLKKYLRRNENRFLELERANLKAIKQIYSMLNAEQKIRLIPKRPKSKSVSTTSSKSSGTTTTVDNKKDADETAIRTALETDNNNLEMSFEQNEAISKVEELLQYLLSNNTSEDSQLDSQSIDTSAASANGIWFTANNNATPTTTSQQDTKLNIAQMPVYTYAELLALYDKERSLRLDLESNFQLKSKEFSKQNENLNREMTNLAIIIEDLRKEYTLLQNQCKHQLDHVMRINDEIRTDCRQLETKNEQLKLESLRLKAENKQFYGEQTMLMREIEDQYQASTNVDEMQRMLAKLRQEMVKLMLGNQALNKQLALSTETVKHLQKVNLDYQRSSSNQDHLVITQSLESELERERKVRIEAETEKQEYKQQLILIKERGQTLIESLKQRNEQNEFEIRRLKEDNAELANQISSLKKDAKNSLSVQEDLVRLIQSLQIELNNKNSGDSSGTSGSGDGTSGPGGSKIIEVRCQHEDDFNDCAACKAQFSVTRRKHRCKHCCKIFCADCCNKTVYSGPNSRPHKVCDMCHTLLDKDLPSNISTS